jgi:NhaP-type Na+/H+ or K+/H+ antiporter
MKFKHVLALFILSTIFILLGALFKIQSWPTAGILLTAGMGLIGVTMLLGVIKLVSYKNEDSILNK